MNLAKLMHQTYQLEGAGMDRRMAAVLVCAIDQVKKNPAEAPLALADLKEVGFTPAQAEAIVDNTLMLTADRHKKEQKPLGFFRSLFTPNPEPSS